MISFEDSQKIILKIIHPILVKNILFDTKDIEYRLSSITLLENYAKYIYHIDLFISIDIPDKNVTYDIKNSTLSITVPY
jgi:hypothetical protein